MISVFDAASGTAASQPELICSAKACGQPAAQALLWNNPSIHTPQRRKVWLACPEHVDHLGQFLSLRGFLKELVPVTEIPEGAG